MPIYEYECQSCHKVFEYMQRMSDDRKTVCEECEGALERIISQSAFHLKGGGWYKDLYSSTKKDGDSKESSTGNESGSGSDSGSDSSGSDAAKSGDASAKSTGDVPAKSKASSDAPAKPTPAKAKASSKE